MRIGAPPASNQRIDRVTNPSISLAPLDAASFALDAAPVAQDDRITMNEDQLYYGSVFGDHGFGPDTDPEGGALHVAAVEGHASYVGLGLNLIAGRVRVMSDGHFWFNAKGEFDYLRAGESVQVSFDYTVADAAGQTDVATVTMTVTGKDDAPVLREDTIYSYETAITSGDVFADNGHGEDRDPDGGPLRVTKFLGSTTEAGDLATLPGGGQVRLMADGRFWFVAGHDFDDLKPGEFRDTAFTYRATDETSTKVSTVTVRVEGFDTPPVATDQSFGTDEAHTLYTSVLGRANSGYDPEGRPVSVFSVNGVKASVGVSIDLEGGGRLRLEKDGHFWFNPDGDFDDLGVGETREVTATYALSDGTRSSTNAELTFTVRGASGPADTTDHLPVARDDHFVFSLSGDKTGNLFEDNGSGVDYDADGDPLSVFLFFAGADGAIVNDIYPTVLDMAEGGRIHVGLNGDVRFDAVGDYGTAEAGDHFDMTYNLRFNNGWADEGTDFVTVGIDIIA